MNINIKAHLRLMLIMAVPAVMLCYFGGYFHAALLGDFSGFSHPELVKVSGDIPITQWDAFESIVTLLLMGTGIANGIYYLVVLIKSRREPMKTIMLCLCFPLLGVAMIIGTIGVIPATIVDLYYVCRYKRYNFFIHFLKNGSVYN